MVQYYTSLGFGPINEALRQGKPHPDVEGMDEVFKELDSYKGIVYRGLSKTGIKACCQGETYQDLGYVSTSISLDVARQFGGQHLLEIHTTRGVDISSISDCPEEMEVLLPRGIKYLIEERKIWKSIPYFVLREII